MQGQIAAVVYSVSSFSQQHPPTERNIISVRANTRNQRTKEKEYTKGFFSCVFSLSETVDRIAEEEIVLNARKDRDGRRRRRQKKKFSHPFFSKSLQKSCRQQKDLGTTIDLDCNQKVE